MSDLIKRADAIKTLKETAPTVWTESDYELGQKNQWSLDILSIECLPSAESDDWLEKNKDLILQAGMEGREVEFRMEGRLFAIREKAQ